MSEVYGQSSSTTQGEITVEAVRSGEEVVPLGGSQSGEFVLTDGQNYVNNN